jgi:hypothetical protein
MNDFFKKNWSRETFYLGGAFAVLMNLFAGLMLVDWRSLTEVNLQTFVIGLAALLGFGSIFVQNSFRKIHEDKIRTQEISDKCHYIVDVVKIIEDCLDGAWGMYKGIAFSHPGNSRVEKKSGNLSHEHALYNLSKDIKNSQLENSIELITPRVLRGIDPIVTKQILELRVKIMFLQLDAKDYLSDGIKRIGDDLRQSMQRIDADTIVEEHPYEGFEEKIVYCLKLTAKISEGSKVYYKN